MAGAISILSFEKDRSSAALVGGFTRDSTEFLAQHLDELRGDVVLECERLEDLDDSSATVLLDFRASRRAQGWRVFFRGIPHRCRERLLELARAR
jgi:hypothetical protein